MTSINPKGILKIQFYSDDLNKTLTIRDYFIMLLKTLWIEGEGFSGKRPFGNSGWEVDLAIPLIESGILEGSIDIDGYIENYDSKHYNEIIFSCIDAL